MGVAETMRALSKGCADVSTRRENECFAQRKRLVVGIHSSGSLCNVPKTSVLRCRWFGCWAAPAVNLVKSASKFR
jgi:hypothetical protein